MSCGRNQEEEKAVAMKDRKTWWDGGEVSNALTTRLLQQYMPDSKHFGAVLCICENHKSEARVREVDVAPTFGASHNASVANDNPLVVTMRDGEGGGKCVDA